MSERPASGSRIGQFLVTGRAILSAGSGNTHIASSGRTAVEEFSMLVKVDGKDTKTVVSALSRK